MDRTQPMLPIRPGLPARRTHDYKRNGTTTLFAALEVATGKVVDACYPRHRHQELLKFLKQVAKAYPRRKLHIVLDNYGTHKHPKVNAWLARNPRVHLHFTPTSGSWLNMVETFFSIITRQAIRRGTFPSVPELIAAIRRYIDAWNERCQPFVWTKDADTILAHANRQNEPVTGQQHHRRSGIGLITPSDVHHTPSRSAAPPRGIVLDDAYAANPERFVRKPPNHQPFPTPSGSTGSTTATSRLPNFSEICLIQAVAKCGSGRVAARFS